MNKADIVARLTQSIEAERIILRREKDPELRGESNGYIIGLQEAIALLRKDT